MHNLDRRRSERAKKFPSQYLAPFPHIQIRLVTISRSTFALKMYKKICNLLSQFAKSSSLQSQGRLNWKTSRFLLHQCTFLMIIVLCIKYSATIFKPLQTSEYSCQRENVSGANKAAADVVDSERAILLQEQQRVSNNRSNNPANDFVCARNHFPRMNVPPRLEMAIKRLRLH